MCEGQQTQYHVLISAYTGPDNQEGMRKTNFRPESNPGLMTSKTALSHDHQIKVRLLIPSYSCSGHGLLHVHQHIWSYSLYTAE